MATIVGSPNLPDRAKLERLCQSLAMLDAILMPDWQYRYYSFNSRWGDGERMASMRDGCGDAYFIVFRESSAILKGFAHESPLARHIVETGAVWPGVLDDVPPSFEWFLTEPALSLEDTTFCMWRLAEDAHWWQGDVTLPPLPDSSGALRLLTILEGDSAVYCEWAEQYYEQPVALESVKRVYNHEPLSERLVQSLNPDLTLAALGEDTREIGYLVQGP